MLTGYSVIFNRNIWEWYWCSHQNLYKKANKHISQNVEWILNMCLRRKAHAFVLVSHRCWPSLLCLRFLCRPVPPVCSCGVHWAALHRPETQTDFKHVYLARLTVIKYWSKHRIRPFSLDPVLWYIWLSGRIMRFLSPSVLIIIFVVRSRMKLWLLSVGCGRLKFMNFVRKCPSWTFLCIPASHSVLIAFRNTFKKGVYSFSVHFFKAQRLLCEATIKSGTVGRTQPKLFC